MQSLDRLFAWTRSSPFLYRLAIFTRVLLAAGFIPTGMVKVLGQRFTQVSPDTPIGSFFEALYQSGAFWHFIGLVQVVAGLLLLVPRLAHLGAILFVPVISSIFVITVGLGFKGTPFVTGPMLLAALFLCFWDFHRFRSMFTLEPLTVPIAHHRLDPWETAGFAAFAVSIIGFFLSTRGLMPRPLVMVVLALGTISGFFTLGRFLWLRQRGRLGRVPAVGGDEGPRRIPEDPVRRAS